MGSTSMSPQAIVPPESSFTHLTHPMGRTHTPWKNLKTRIGMTEDPGRWHRTNHRTTTKKKKNQEGEPRRQPREGQREDPTGRRDLRLRISIPPTKQAENRTAVPTRPTMPSDRHRPNRIGEFPCQSPTIPLTTACVRARQRLAFLHRSGPLCRGRLSIPP